MMGFEGKDEGMSEQQQYRPGDVVNGHVLGSDNYWRPVVADRRWLTYRALAAIVVLGALFWFAAQWVWSM